MVKFISAGPEASSGGHGEVTAGLVSGPLEQSEIAHQHRSGAFRPAIDDHMIGVIMAMHASEPVTFNPR